VKTTTLVTIIGEIDPQTVERKTVKEKALTEFRIRELGLRISAWEARAAMVPNAGTLVVSGYLSTRTYTHEGQDRQTTEVRATTIQVLDSAPDIDNAEPF